MQRLRRDGAALLFEEARGAFDLAARCPDLPSSLVMLDVAVVLPLPPALPSRVSFRSYVARITGRCCAGFVADSLFIPTDDQELKQRIPQSMSSAPQHVVVPAFEGRATTTPPRRVERRRCRVSTWPPTNCSRARTWRVSTRCSPRSCTARPWARGTSASSACPNRSTR